MQIVGVPAFMIWESRESLAFPYVSIELDVNLWKLYPLTSSDKILMGTEMTHSLKPPNFVEVPWIPGFPNNYDSLSKSYCFARGQWEIAWLNWGQS